MKYVKRIQIPVVLILAALLAACVPIQESPLPSVTPPAQVTEEPSETQTEEPTEELSLINTQWTLESLGPAEEQTPAVGETPITLEFTNESQIAGSGGCNSYSGEYQIQDGELVIGQIISTLMACVDEDAMGQETDYFDALQSAGAFEFTEDHLTIYYEYVPDTTNSTQTEQGALNFVLATTTTPAEPEQEDETPTAEPEANVNPSAGSASAPESAAESQDFAWHCYNCGGNQLWVFEDGQATQIEIPVEIGVYYDYDPTTNRILYGSRFPTHGEGPGQISVTDLFMMDLESQQPESIFDEEIIVEAEWAPSGEQLIYVLATDQTYELHWRELDGEDKILAADVAFTFGVSPNGEQVAFTRESNYEVDGEPGLYVVDIASGEERMLADTDRAGAGSIEDKPIWSPDSQYILLATNGMAENPGMIRAAADGSNTTTLSFDPALSGEDYYEMEPYNGLWIAENEVLGTALLSGPNMQMGGEPSLVLYELNEALDTVVGGKVISQGQLVGWDVPGSSVWVQVGAEMQSIPLPIL